MGDLDGQRLIDQATYWRRKFTRWRARLPLPGSAEETPIDQLARASLSGLIRDMDAVSRKLRAEGLRASQYGQRSPRGIPRLDEARPKLSL